MKKVSFLCLFLIFGIILNGQKLDYYKDYTTYKGEIVPAINVIIEPGTELIERKFEEWISVNYDIDLSDKKFLFFEKDIMSAKAINLEDFGSRKFDLFIKVDNTVKGYTSLKAFASFGYNNWINKRDYPDEFSQLQELIYGFVTEYLPEYYFERMSNTKGKIEDINENLETLNNRVADNELRIEYLQDQNRTLNALIHENAMEIDSIQSKLLKHKLQYDIIRGRLKNM